jgi:hypothetical protein
MSEPMNIRQCDICKATAAQSSEWFFVTDGKVEPSAWRLAQHWCPVCYEAALDYLKELRA